MTTNLADEKYVSLTTYKRDGSTKSLPVWIVDLADATVGFTTSSSSYKVKRINNDNRVNLQASDAKGNVKAGSEVLTGTAVATTSDLDRVAAKVKAKYGIQHTAITAFGRVMKLIGKGSGTDTAVIITLD